MRELLSTVVECDGVCVSMTELLSTVVECDGVCRCYKVRSAACWWPSAQYQRRGARLGISIRGHEATTVWCWWPACVGNSAKDPQPSNAHDVSCKLIVIKLLN